MCLHFGTFRFCFFGWIPKEGDSPSWPEESKETGGFVAGNPTGTASPWHTTLLAKSSHYTFVKGLAVDGLFCPQGWGKRSLAWAEIAERLQRKAAAWASTEQRDTFSLRISAPNNQKDLHRIRVWYHYDIKCWYHCDTTSREYSSFTAWYRLSASSVLPDRTVL